MSKRSVLSAVIVGFLAVVGCGEAGSSGEAPESEAPGAVEGRASGEAGPAGGAAASGSVSAEAMLEDREAGVSVSVTLAGLAPGERYPVHVHEGTCEEGGPVRLPLGRVTARPDGTGSVRMSVGPDRLPEPPLFVQVMGPDGQPTACAELTGATGP